MVRIRIHGYFQTLIAHVHDVIAALQDCMPSHFSKLNTILDGRDVRRLTLLSLPITLSAILEALSVLSILPFMQTAFADQTQLTGRKNLFLMSFFDTTDRSTLLIWFGSMVLVLFAASVGMKVITAWFTQKTVWQCAHRISMDLVNQYARQPYEFFLVNNSADLIKKAISDIQSLVSGILMVTCRFVENVAKATAVLVLLLFIDYRLTLLATTIFGGVYFVIHLFRARYIEELGKSRQRTIGLRIKTFSETLAGIKTIRVAGKTPWFVSRFESASKEFCRIHPIFQLYSLIPRSVVEFLAFGGIIAFVLGSLLNGNELDSIAPKLSIFALATYRLLPSLGTAFAQAATFSHNLPVIDDVYEDKRLITDLLRPIKEIESAEPLNFDNQIALKDVSFCYQSSDLPVLSDISLTVGKSRKIALVGLTGCGKSTLLQLMVGLLKPVSGKILIDATQLDTENSYRWHRNLAYVPQEVFLFDDSIAANIALGESKSERDEARLNQAIKIAQVDQFLDSEFRHGAETVVGELGVRLSGGQRQRIGLARAIYCQPEVLFLDEATSALDSITEDAIMAALNHELPDLTIVMVAHRLSSTRFCDEIVLMNRGRITAIGPFSELVESNSQFRQMVELAE